MSWHCNRFFSITEIHRANGDTQKIMETNLLTEKIIVLAIEVNRHLGPGLLESAYKEFLFYEIKKIGLTVES